MTGPEAVGMKGNPSGRGRIYFDNAASTPADPRVVEAMLPYFTERSGNPSSLHQHGLEAQEAVECAREKVAKAIGARAEGIVFTAGGTESDNLAIIGRAHADRKRGKHVITSSIEHLSLIHI